MPCCDTARANGCMGMNVENEVCELMLCAQV
jgi:hypothetical protein